MARTQIPTASYDRLLLLDSAGSPLSHIAIGSPEWYKWLQDEQHASFAYKSDSGNFTARREQLRRGWYWYGYRKRENKLHKVYLGKSEELSLERLSLAARALSGQSLAQENLKRRQVVEELLTTIEPGDKRAALDVSDEVASPHKDDVGGMVASNKYYLLSQLTPLVGRDQEAHEVAELLRATHVRLLTLTGTGGIGKTRLSLQVATELLDTFADGVYLVLLATVTVPRQVPIFIANALGLGEAGEGALVERLYAFLKEKRLLLILDNFEQVIAAAPQLVELLARCPQVKILMTSRAVLHVVGEQEYPVLPLPLPVQDQVDTQVLAQSAAVQLFVQRAQAVQPGFRLTAENAATIAAIARRLDGLPLAIELAAARMKVFSPQALLQRLEKRLPLLTSTTQDVPERQQTLSNTLDWSYDLLAPREQRLFKRLSIFAGGCTLPMIEHLHASLEQALGIDQERPLLLDDLTSLIDKSLLSRVEQEDHEARFFMLEIIREYGLERLQQEEDVVEVQRAYAYYWQQQALMSEKDMDRHQDQEMWRIRLEHKNLRTALIWFAQQGQWDDALKLASALWWFWWAKGYIGEGRRTLEWLLSSAKEVSPFWHAKALSVTALMIALQGEYKQAIALAEKSRVIFAELEQEFGQGMALWTIGHAYVMIGEGEQARTALEAAGALVRNKGHRWANAAVLERLASLARDEGNLEQALSLCEQSLAIHQQAGSTWGQARALWMLGLIHFSRADLLKSTLALEACIERAGRVGDRISISYASVLLGVLKGLYGDMQEGDALIEQGLQLARDLGDQRGMSWGLTLLGWSYALQGEYTRARECQEESLSLLAVTSYEYKTFVAYALDGLALAVVGQGYPAWAARLWGAAQAVRQGGRSVPAIPATIQSIFSEFVQQARALLGEESFKLAFAEGLTMTPSQVLQARSQAPLSLSSASIPNNEESHTAAPNSTVLAGLTTREIEVLRLLATGMTSAQIAEKLVISILTVNTHVRSIYSKLGVTSRSAATRYALEHKLLP
ncbi:LuxR C-terminal-related transcriptional regulator [Ktedonobacter racemifer]|uniref:Transcriptional regulator, LuxR family n=1 Tax=Ktedonobacter racemifer DSM 44963 TaxID=485913 RepID=D6TD49_KTERA|nr:LuxR C-terminal-related transcriptional regulator [Ktedonobacter racemifer]EFH90100.1 transcriptional regulator, LuxR family [Ktedonobacter racemifer DSM 44963]